MLVIKKYNRGKCLDPVMHFDGIKDKYKKEKHNEVNIKMKNG